jgi:hypothetical protein
MLNDSSSANVIISDASCLIGLTNIKQLEFSAGSKAKLQLVELNGCFVNFF